MLRALGLVRVSNEDHARNGYTVPDQQRKIEHRCKTRGWKLTETLVDGGVSGESYSREGLDRARELAKGRAVDVLVLIDASRLSRDPAEFFALVRWFKRQRVEVEFTDHASPGQDPGTDLQVGLLALLARYQLEEMRRKTRGARAEKAREGKVPQSLVLFGYRVVQKWQVQAGQFPARDHGRVLIEESEAAVVREIFRRAGQGEPLYAIARWLNEQGIRTAKGFPWRPTTVRQTLSQTAYVGEFIYGRCEWHRYFTEGDRKAKVERTPLPESSWIRIPVPPILTDAAGNPDHALFARLQLRLAENARLHNGRPTLHYPLRGVIHCAECVGKGGKPRVCSGTRYSGNKGCATYYKRRYICQGCCATTQADPVEQRAFRRLSREVQPGRLGEAARRASEKRNRELGHLDAQLEAAQAELHRLDEEERGIARQIMAGISAHIVAESVASVQARRAAAHTRLQSILQQAAQRADPAAAEARAEVLAAEIRERLELARTDPAELQRLFQQYIRVVVKKAGGAHVRVVIPLEGL